MRRAKIANEILLLLFIYNPRDMVNAVCYIFKIKCEQNNLKFNDNICGHFL